MRSGRLEHLHTLAVLWRQPSRSRADLVRLQNRKLRYLVEHAFRNVPFYRRRFDEAGLRPGDIRSPADLARLPITTKAELRAAPIDAVIDRAVDPARLITRFTSGSTGEPVSMKRTAAEAHLLNMFRVRAQRMLGLRLRDRTAHVHVPGVPSDRGASRPAWARRVPLLRTIDVNCLQPVPDAARALARVGADIVRGYPTVLAEIADLWPRLDVHARAPRLVVTGGEALDPAMRARIARGFGAPVFDFYGAHEVNLIAWECGETGALHVCDDNVIVEILRDGRPAAPGESGEVVVTGLHGYAAPRIRYALGDLATRGRDACACGLPFSTLEEVRGRTMDYIVLPGGRQMHHWEMIPMSFWDRGWHRRYRVVQEAGGAVALQIVAAGPHPAPAAVERLQEEIRQRLGKAVPFRIEFVDELTLTAAGKHRLCVSQAAVAAART